MQEYPLEENATAVFLSAIISFYYMVSSLSGQDESNLRLPTKVGKMELSYPLGTTLRFPEEKFSRKPYNKFFIDQAGSVKIA